jgi:hypothetical protein
MVSQGEGGIVIRFLQQLEWRVYVAEWLPMAC